MMSRAGVILIPPLTSTGGERKGTEQERRAEQSTAKEGNVRGVEAQRLKGAHAIGAVRHSRVPSSRQAHLAHKSSLLADNSSLESRIHPFTSSSFKLFRCKSTSFGLNYWFPSSFCQLGRSSGCPFLSDARNLYNNKV